MSAPGEENRLATLGELDAAVMKIGLVTRDQSRRQILL